MSTPNEAGVGWVGSELHNLPAGESEDAAAGGKGEGGGVHWGLIASGVCGAVLLLGLVAVVGLSTYAYRQRHRNRHRW